MSLTRRITRSVQSAPFGGSKTPGVSQIAESFQMTDTTAGKTVTVERAIRLSACWAAVRVLSDSVGTLPLKVFAFTRGGGRAEAFYTPAWALLHDRPNAEMTPSTFVSLITTHLNTWGDAFIGKIFDGNTVVELWPIRPDRVRVIRRNGVKLFFVKDELGIENPKPYTSAEIIHIQGISLDGLRGLSPIEIAAEAFGAGLALEEFANRHFSNSALPAGVLQTAGELSDGAAERMRKRWESLYKGVRNAGKVAVLEEGLTFDKISFPLKDLQFVEEQGYKVQDIARIFRIPPSKIAGDSGKSLTYNTVESDNLAFVTDSVRPWCVRIEQALAADDDLFPRRADRPSIYPEFVMDALLRADTKSRYEALAIATGNRPWMNPSEVRSLENLPPDAAIDALPPPAPPQPGG